MYQKDFITMVSHRSGYRVKDIKMILDSVQPVLLECLRDGEVVPLFNGINIEAPIRKAYTQKNILFKKDYYYPEKRIMRIKTSKRVEEFINTEPSEGEE